MADVQIGFGSFLAFYLADLGWSKETVGLALMVGGLAGVLAHEIGHCKKRHVPKMLAWSAAGLLVSLYAVAWLAKQNWFYDAGRWGPT